MSETTTENSREISARAILAINEIGERDQRDARLRAQAALAAALGASIAPDMLKSHAEIVREMMGFDPRTFSRREPPRAALLDAPNPEKLFAHGPDPELEAHAALAAKLGVVVRPKLLGMKLQNVLAEEGITCYDKKAVHAYMDSLASQTPDTCWFWFHALQHQVGTDALASIYHQSHREYLKATQGSIVGSLYRDAIPLPVLVTIDKLVTRLGDQVVPVIGATFDLSKLRPAPADPFLAVFMRDEEVPMFIIERWDEPGFRGVAA